jgi:hypothetical protein
MNRKYFCNRVKGASFLDLFPRILIPWRQKKLSFVFEIISPKFLQQGPTLLDESLTTATVDSVVVLKEES